MFPVRQKQIDKKIKDMGMKIMKRGNNRSGFMTHHGSTITRSISSIPLFLIAS